MNDETLIEKYLDNTLSLEERDLLRSRLQSDPEFASQFELEKDLKAVLVDKGKEELKQQLETMKGQKENVASSKSNLGFLKYAVAACIIIGATLLAVNMLTPSLTNNQLFAENFEPYRNIIAPVERGETPQDLLGKSFAAYERQSYEEAQQSFKDLYEATGDRYLLFYRANALLALGRDVEAIEVFKSHQETPDNFLGKSKWYLALSYLKADDTPSAIVLLKEIKTMRTFNYDKAINILEELE